MCAFYGDHGLVDDYTGVVLDLEEGKHIAHALGERKAVILRNRGSLTIASGGRWILGVAFEPSSVRMDGRVVIVIGAAVGIGASWLEHHGEFFSFDAVACEPKPVQRPWPPILVGGESEAGWADEPFETCRLLVAPWQRSPEVVDGLARFAALVGLAARQSQPGGDG